jgi:SAM-dependent methyltransferase
VQERRDAPYPELKKTHTMWRLGRPWTDRKPPTSASVWDVIDGFGRYHALVSALELGLFEALDTLGPSTAAAVAEQAGTAMPHTEILLDGLVGMRFLEQRHGIYQLAEVAERYLVRSGPATMVDLVPVAPGPLGNWSRLTETVRTGAPAEPIDDDPAAFYLPLVHATFPTILRCALRSELQLRFSGAGPIRLLDLGAGGAPWAVGVLTLNPEATAVVNDLPGVIEEAARRTEAHGVADRVELRAGDALEVDIEPGAYDVVVLGHVLRAIAEADSHRLIDRAFEALRPGGRLLVGDYFVDRERSQNPHALMMGVTMMASTRHGRTRTVAEHVAWVQAAGFGHTRLIEPIGFQEVLVARKPLGPVAPASSVPPTSPEVHP